ncbi:MAG: ParB N-terminal domain-containing protein [Nitrosarchaeum sp.]|nr:ParB N-terminal domain-containing protein [Nitrosarchaeum sp.]
MRKGKQQLLESIRYVPSSKIPISKIKLDPNNPNVLSDEKMRGLEKIMKDPEVGNAVEVWVNDNGDGTYLCIDGEHRIKVLQKNNIKFVWGKIFKVSYTKVRILRQIANKLHGIHDKKKDADEFKAILDDNELEEFSKMMGEPISEFQKIIDKEFNFESASAEIIDELETLNHCPKCGYEW